ncbi:MAG: glycosyltransferase, partial [Pirellulaceae bacterium]
AGLSVLTSKEEGYSLVVLESLSHGCPVVSFDVKYGPSEMIGDGESGYLVPFADEEAFVSRIVEILSDPARHKRMCDIARQSISRFTGDVVVEGWNRLLREVTTDQD